MEYRRLGTSGLKVSEIALGAWLTYGARWSRT
jgi:aryl-alcohol dehydrogenase-like predicted oxidoreductase